MIDFVLRLLFVLAWSSGFMGIKVGLLYAEPFTFLLARFSLVSLFLVVVSLALRVPWPTSTQQFCHIAVAGLLVHGLYLSGVFAAMACGMPAGTTALIVGLQPVLTATVAPRLFDERVGPCQWLGLILGLVGVGLVVSEKLSLRSDLSGILWASAGLIGITSGTLYQKRFCGEMDLRTGTAVQYAAACCLLLVLAINGETMHIDWTWSFIWALLWLTFVLSVGAIFLLFLLIRRGEAARVASLFYLTPATTAIMAWAIFNEALPPIVLIGFVVTTLGVGLAQR